MDVQRLIGEIARRHSTLVEPHDPIFLLLTLNETLLEDHLRRVSESCAGLERAAERLAAVQSDRMTRVAVQMLDAASRQASSAVRFEGERLAAQLGRAIDDGIARAQAVAAKAAHAQRLALMAAGTAVGCAIIVGAALLVLLVRHR